MEREPQSELDTHLLGNRSLREWHTWLTHDLDGNYTGDLRVPCSRYGRTGAQVAWWAIALECVIVDATGMAVLAAESGMDYSMGLAVNDSDDVGELVREGWHAIPQALREQIEGME